MSVRARGAAAAGSPTVRVAAIVLLLGGALAALLVVTFVHRPQAPGAELADRITVKRAFSSTAVLFGDPVDAEVDVVSRDADVPARSVHVVTSFAPFTVVATKIDRAHVDGASLLRTTIRLQCVARACLPPSGGVRSAQFPPILVRYVRNGTPASTALPWGPLQVSSRVPRGAAGVGVIDTAPPLDPRFARSPDAIRAALLVATALLAFGGAVLLVTALWPASSRARRRWEKLSPLERSLLRVEAAAGSGDETGRRRTLDQLALRLGEVQSSRLEQQTRALAWGEAPPAPEDLTRLATEVRTTLNGKVRG